MEKLGKVYLNQGSDVTLGVLANSSYWKTLIKIQMMFSYRVAWNFRGSLISRIFPAIYENEMSQKLSPERKKSAKIYSISLCYWISIKLTENSITAETERTEMSASEQEGDKMTTD